MRRLRLFVAVGIAAIAGGCPSLDEPEPLLSVRGTLDRDSIEESAAGHIDVDFASLGARGEWWPCDLRVTAQGCIGDHHVNVYIALPQVTRLAELGRDLCVVDGEPVGVFERMQAAGAGKHRIGIDLNAFIVVASDMDDEPGARIDQGLETTAATRLVAGELQVTGWGGVEGLSFQVDGTTAGGHDVSVTFAGRTTSPGAVPLLEDASTCVDRPALKAAS